MLKTTRNLVNSDRIYEMLINIVQTSYKNIKDEEILLCLDCLDVDLYVATEENDEFDDAIKENFELDENYEIIDYNGYRKLMDELDQVFVDLHKTTGLFDYFPPGQYKVGDEIRVQTCDFFAPKGVFYAPYEDALKRGQVTC